MVVVGENGWSKTGWWFSPELGLGRGGGQRKMSGRKRGEEEGNSRREGKERGGRRKERMRVRRVEVGSGGG